MDADKFTSLFTENARMTFGNQPPFEGSNAVRDGVKGFFVAHVDATYQRKDGTGLTPGAVTIYHTDGDGKIDDYRVFVDVTPIYV